MGDTWDFRYALSSAPHGDPDREPRWAPAGNEHIWPNLGIIGPGPDRVIIPPDAEPGQYRICTANLAEDFCAPLEVTG